MKRARAWLLSLALAFAACGPAIGQPLGDKPGYLWGGLSSVANRQAIDVTIWAPGLDDGYVPQGIAHHGATVGHRRVPQGTPAGELGRNCG